MTIEQLHRLPPGHRELVAVVEPPGHAEQVERLTAEAQDVAGLVLEVVARIFVPADAAGKVVAHAVEPAVAVGMDETPDEPAGMRRDDLPLPRLEHDRPLVLPAGTVLREQVRPVLGVGVDVLAPLFLPDAHLVGRPDGTEGVDAFLDEPRPSVGAGDAQGPDLFGPVADPAEAAVAEVEAQEGGVAVGGGGGVGFGGAAGAGAGHRGDVGGPVTPPANGGVAGSGLPAGLADAES
ncbi:hypothetical protein [Nonomuraea sp. NPDC050643]|uniref:hypothetical protein n=1 Tax=Nonomuraea sp. NPDC050643 TaxID=3155660 RepID=UPI0033C1F848